MLHAMHEGKINVKPEDVGYDGSKLEALNAHYTKLIECGTLQGASYLISKNGQIFARSAMDKSSPAQQWASFVMQRTAKSCFLSQSAKFTR